MHRHAISQANEQMAFHENWGQKASPCSILEGRPLLESMPVDSLHLIINIANFLVNTIDEITNRCFHETSEDCGMPHDYEENLEAFVADLNKSIKRSYWDGCRSKPKMMTGNQGC